MPFTRCFLFLIAAGHYSERKNGSSIGNIPFSLIIAVALISLIALAVLSSTIVCICLQRRRMPKLRGKQYLSNNVNCFLLPIE